MSVISHSGRVTAVSRFLLLASTLSCWGSVQAESRVIKCTDAKGRVVFTQTGCSEGVRETLRVVNPRIGWIGQKPGTAARRDGSSSAPHAGEERSQTAPEVGVAQRQRCWRAEQRIARIDDERRRGYRLQRGRELRREREEWEEYLRLFCD